MYFSWCNFILLLFLVILINMVLCWHIPKGIQSVSCLFCCTLSLTSDTMKMETIINYFATHAHIPRPRLSSIQQPQDARKSECHWRVSLILKESPSWQYRHSIQHNAFSCHLCWVFLMFTKQHTFERLVCVSLLRVPHIADSWNKLDVLVLSLKLRKLIELLDLRPVLITHMQTHARTQHTTGEKKRQSPRKHEMLTACLPRCHPLQFCSGIQEQWDSCSYTGCPSRKHSDNTKQVWADELCCLDACSSDISPSPLCIAN